MAFVVVGKFTHLWLYQKWVKITLLLEVFNGVSKDLDAVAFLGVRFPTAAVVLLLSGPIRMVSPVIEGFRMRHQAEDSSGRIANAGNVLQRTIRIFWKATIGRIPLAVGIAQDHLVIFQETVDYRLVCVELAFAVSNGKFQVIKSFGEHTR